MHISTLKLRRACEAQLNHEPKNIKLSSITDIVHIEVDTLKTIVGWNWVSYLFVRRWKHVFQLGSCKADVCSNIYFHKLHWTLSNCGHFFFIYLLKSLNWCQYVFIASYEQHLFDLFFPQCNINSTPILRLLQTYNTYQGRSHFWRDFNYDIKSKKQVPKDYIL